MDELTAVLRARSLVNKVAPRRIPVDLDAYANEVQAKIKVAEALGADEDGFSMMMPNGAFGICVNGMQSAERQRFTICHELAHIILELPSEHGTDPSWSYTKRAPNEILCDVFAAELLLPYKLFKPLVDKADHSLVSICALAKQFEASLLATGSRFAALSKLPCAFVLCEKGKIRYASRSAALRDARGWIAFGANIPEGSIASRTLAGGIDSEPEEVDVEVWFADWEQDGTLIEDARRLPAYDQTVSLLWFEDIDDLHSRIESKATRDENSYGLAELDGVLLWPGRSRRR